jgi:hypothetical protein
MSEFFIECVEKFPRKFSLEKFRVLFGMEILLGTNVERTRNFSYSDILLDFFLRNYSYGKNFKLLRRSLIRVICV